MILSEATLLLLCHLGDTTARNALVAIDRGDYYAFVRNGRIWTHGRM